jgi:hypothetical protein
MALDEFIECRSTVEAAGAAPIRAEMTSASPINAPSGKGTTSARPTVGASSSSGDVHCERHHCKDRDCVDCALAHQAEEQPDGPGRSSHTEGA